MLEINEALSSKINEFLRVIRPLTSRRMEMFRPLPEGEDYNNFTQNTVLSYIHSNSDFDENRNVVLGLCKDGTIRAEVWRPTVGMDYVGNKETLVCENLSPREVISFVEKSLSLSNWDREKRFLESYFDVYSAPGKLYSYKDNLNYIDSLYESYLYEDQCVKFDGELWPKYGWCVILCGSPASGKSTVAKHALPISGFKLDVDSFKKLYTELIDRGGLQGNPDDPNDENWPNRYASDKKVLSGEDWNLLDPEETSRLHGRLSTFKISKDVDPERTPIYGNAWKGRKVKYFVKGVLDHIDDGKLTNIIFDMTGKDSNEIYNISKDFKMIAGDPSKGYKTCLVWVLTDIQSAMLFNLTRDRHVFTSFLREVHLNIANAMKEVFATKCDYIDEAWILFNEASVKRMLQKVDPASRPVLIDFFERNMASRLVKSGNGFKLDPRIEDIIKFMAIVEREPTESSGKVIQFKSRQDLLNAAKEMFPDFEYTKVEQLWDKFKEAHANGEFDLEYVGPSDELAMLTP